MIRPEDFDPEIVREYGITPRKLARVLRYVNAMPEMGRMSLTDIALGGFYGTSALLHEVVELAELEAQDPALLSRTSEQVRRALQRNFSAHIKALAAEYRYSQEKIEEVFGQQLGIGALILANALRRDFTLLLESDEPLPIFEPSPDKVAQARVLLDKLRSLGKEMPK